MMNPQASSCLSEAALMKEFQPPRVLKLWFPWATEI